MELNIRVQPKARRNSIEVSDDGKVVVVRVTVAPEGGKANDAVVALLAKQLGVAKRRIQITRGHRARDKQVHIEDITTEEVLSRLK